MPSSIREDLPAALRVRDGIPGPEDPQEPVHAARRVLTAWHGWVISGWFEPRDPVDAQPHESYAQALAEGRAARGT